MILRADSRLVGHCDHRLDVLQNHQTSIEVIHYGRVLDKRMITLIEFHREIGAVLRCCYVDAQGLILFIRLGKHDPEVLDLVSRRRYEEGITLFQHRLGEELKSFALCWSTR